MPDRVVIFIDYQNVYRGAREAFHQTGDPHWQGQINPLLLGHYLAADSIFDRRLMQVRVYRGMPEPTRDPKGHAAVQKQLLAWTASPLVVPITRPLKYPRGWPDHRASGARPQEKGIDVALAVDYVVMAARREYDVGILFSTDTDMKPALEFVAGLMNSPGRPRAEVAVWAKTGNRLRIATRNLYCHWLKEATYEQVADRRSYSKD